MQAQPSALIASRAARGFELFECQECADSVRLALQAAGIAGAIIEIRDGFGKDFIACGCYDNWRTTISQNGRHVGVRVGNLMFDNLHPDGLPYQVWIDDFDARGGIVVHSITEF